MTSNEPHAAPRVVIIRGNSASCLSQCARRNRRQPPAADQANPVTPSG